MVVVVGGVVVVVAGMVVVEDDDDVVIVGGAWRIDGSVVGVWMTVVASSRAGTVVSEGNDLGAGAVMTPTSGSPNLSRPKARRSVMTSV